MDCIIFIGIPATGKSSFYKQEFFHSHIRINLDMLRTRHREALLFEACLKAKQPVVIDNTNVTRELRAVYIKQAIEAKFTVRGYYFQSKSSDALQRNQKRIIKQRVPDKAILGMAGQLEFPSYGEGFNQLYYVSMTADLGFSVKEWDSE